MFRSVSEGTYTCCNTEQ